MCSLPPHAAPRNSLTELYSLTDVISPNLGVAHPYHIQHKLSCLGGPDRLKMDLYTE